MPQKCNWTCFLAKCPLIYDWIQILFSCTGMFEHADRCCREHDHCPHIIPALTVNYGVFNSKFFTVSHCDCDQRWVPECTPRESYSEPGFQVFGASRETTTTSNSHLPLALTRNALASSMDSQVSIDLLRGWIYKRSGNLCSSVECSHHIILSLCQRCKAI